MNDSDAIRALALCYQRGRGVEQNETLAFELVVRAEKLKHRETRNDLGVYFEQGRGVDQNTAMALYCYRLAAFEGHALAKDNFQMLNIPSHFTLLKQTPSLCI
jgi:TPR repeat protein